MNITNNLHFYLNTLDSKKYITFDFLEKEIKKLYETYIFM